MVDILLAVSQCPHCGLDGHRLVVTKARKVLESYSLEIKCSTCNRKRFAGPAYFSGPTKRFSIFNKTFLLHLCKHTKTTVCINRY